MNPKAIIFDMDGLLVHTEPLWVQAQIEILSNLGADISEESCARTKGLRIDEVVAEYYHQKPWNNHTISDIAQKISHRVGTLFQEQGQLLDGVETAIQTAKKLRIPVALASSSPMSLILQILQHAELIDRFDAIFSAEDDPYGKPHPGIYLRTAKALNVLPQHCIAIEDSFFGLLAAKSARMHCIVVPETEHPQWVIADHTLTTLSQLTLQHLKIV